MNRDDVLRMARESDCLDPQHYGSMWSDKLERFAALVAAHEREECAKMCDEEADDRWKKYRGERPYSKWEKGCADSYVEGQADSAENCAAAIRARGES